MNNLILPEDETNPAPADKTLSAPNYFIYTSPEMDALERAADDGKHGLNYASTPQGESLSHVVPGASHYVKIELTPTESMAGVTTAAKAHARRLESWYFSWI